MRYVIGFSFVALAVWALQATGILMTIMIFLMVGSVPGTSISLSPTAMLAMLTLLSALVLFWLFRQRPIDQIKQMRQAYHQQVGHTSSVTPTKQLDHAWKRGFKTSYQGSLRATWQWRSSVVARVESSLRGLTSRLAAGIRPVRTLAAALAAVVGIAAAELAAWGKPHAARILAWWAKQASYSLRGTMLSAHKWSSLSKKLWSSSADLLSRCNSALKRGKSLLIRADR